MNLILVVTDALRADHTGCYGNEAIKTPCLDAFARRQAVRFTNVFGEGLPTIQARRRQKGLAISVGLRYSIAHGSGRRRRPEDPLGDHVCRRAQPVPVVDLC